MSIRSTIVGDGNWHNVGTGPATIQLISPDANGVEVMVYCGATQPATSADGMVLSSENSVLPLSSANTIWAQVIQANFSATLAVQPQATFG